MEKQTFTWGRELEAIVIRLDGGTFTVIKYHPRKADGGIVTQEIDETQTLYHCGDIHRSTYSLDAMVLALLAYSRIGLNQWPLVAGMARALCIAEEEGK